MKIVFLFILTLIIGACSQSLIGTYITKGSDNFHQVTFDFKSDSTLEVTSWSDILGETRKTGQWHKVGNTVYTPNSLIQNEVLSYSFGKNSNSEYFRVFILDKFDNVGINLARVSINNGEEILKLEGNGIYTASVLEPQSVKSVNVKYLTQENTIVINDNLGDFNELIIYFDFEKSIVDIIYSQSWLYKGRKMYSLDSIKTTLIRMKSR